MRVGTGRQRLDFDVNAQARVDRGESLLQERRRLTVRQAEGADLLRCPGRYGSSRDDRIVVHDQRPVRGSMNIELHAVRPESTGGAEGGDGILQRSEEHTS